MSMNTAVALPRPRKQTLASIVISRLRSLVAAPTERDRSVKAVARPYSFLSECECPHDCLRDHENE